MNHKEIPGIPKVRTVLLKDGAIVIKNVNIIKEKKLQKCFRFKEAKNNEHRVKGKERRKMLKIRFWCTTL